MKGKLRNIRMPALDLILLHAPSVYDFRQRPALLGPVSDLVPSTPIFETYPLGLSTMAEYLERFGLQVRTFNLAFLMLQNERFDVERHLAGFRPRAFGIDLHWMPHCHGAIEVARICKRLHPDIPVIFGGLSSSVYHEELLEGYSCIDYVLRGDSTEEPLRQLMDVLPRYAGDARPSREALGSIPNLTWRDATGTVIANELSYSPKDFNTPALDFSYNMKSVIRYHDLFGAVPFQQWLRYPMSAGLICRGCTHNCVTCGGSAATFKKHFGRKKVAFRDPELLVRDIAHAQRYIPGPVFVLNDFLQAGPDYTRTFIEGLGKVKLKASVGFEVFSPPSEELYELLSENLADWSIEVSAETHDDDLRRDFGKGHYTMAELEDSIRFALDAGATRFDLYFMSGIPGQTAQSVRDTVFYLEGLYERIGNDRRLLANIAPMAPFLDPGSLVFDDPEHYGYKLRAKTIEEHRQLLLEPSWKHIMNYESISLPPDELVEVTYEAGLLVNDLKEAVGLNTPQVAEETRQRIREAQEAMQRVDSVMAKPAGPARAEELSILQQDMEELSESTICEKTELRWPVNFAASNLVACVRLFITEVLKGLITFGRTPASSDVHAAWEREHQQTQEQAQEQAQEQTQDQTQDQTHEQAQEKTQEQTQKAHEQTSARGRVL